MKEARHRRPHIVRFYLDEMSRIGKFIETEGRLVITWGWEWEQGLMINEHEGSYWGSENVLRLIMVMAAPHSKVTKNHLIIHLK